MLTTLDGPAVIDAKARCWLRIMVFAYPTCIRRRRNIAIRFGLRKIRMMWLPDGEKIKDMITRFHTWQTPRQTDGRTDRLRMTA